MTPLEHAHDLPLRGVNLIEASAGTGKTYTIASLVTRIALSGAQSVQKVLAVTFTRPAAADLVLKIRERLNEVGASLDSGSHDDPLVAHLLAAGHTVEKLQQRLVLARLDLDLVSFLTIDGFLLRVLTRYPSLIGYQGEGWEVGDGRDLLRTAALDYWRFRMADADELLVEALAQTNLTPDSLATELETYVERPELRVVPAASPSLTDIADHRQTLTAALDDIRRRGRGFVDEAMAVLSSDPGINRSWLRVDKCPEVEGELTKLLIDGTASVKKVDVNLLAKATATVLAVKMKKGFRPPEHELFALLDPVVKRVNWLADAQDSLLAEFRRDALEFVNSRLPALRAERNVQTYNGVLHSVREALASPGGEQLAAAIRADFPIAIVDEYQDTSPAQADVFSRIYAGRSDAALYQVGDPKQAIYNFRGADVVAYLAARRKADQGFELQRNWRSTPGLVAHVNAAFASADRPFLFGGLPFEPVRPAPTERDRFIVAADGGQVELTGVAITTFDKTTEIKPAQSDAFQQAAQQIAALLRLADLGKLKLGSRPLRAADVGVLLQTHKHVGIMSDRLAELGVGSVRVNMDSVFDTNEARDVQQLLAAVVHWGDRALVRGALLTLLGDYHAATLATEGGAGEALSAFDDWRRRCAAGDLCAVIIALADRVADLRARTNYRHLAELLAIREQQGTTDLGSLLRWLGEQIEANDSGIEAHQLRLESDENLVQLATIHASKGLEYAVVFCPDLGFRPRAPATKDAPELYHDPANHDVLSLDFKPDEVAKAMAEHDRHAEHMRLTYVALTRARNRVYLFTSERRASTTFTGLTYLLTGGDADGDFAAARKRWAKDKKAGSSLAERAEALGWSLVLPEFDQPLGTSAQEGAPLHPARPRTFSGHIDDRWTVTSFSALDEHVDQPSGVVLPDRLDAFGFPAGPQAGLCLHAILEALPAGAVEEDDLTRATAAALNRYGFHPRWTPVAQDLVTAARETELQRGLKLSGLGAGDTVSELPFDLQVGDFDRADLYALFGRTQVGQQPLRGYLRGYIDLVFRDDGRYYLLDYKSNWLGDGYAHYASERLPAAMITGNYDLQYHLYVVALHRWLQRTVPGYCYEKHFGGVFYLFLRGMAPESRHRSGVFFDRPSATRLQQVETLLDLDHANPA